MKAPEFSPDTLFFDVEGIPVTVMAGPKATPGMAAAAWDVKPPRRFDPDSARRNGAPIDRAAFLSLLRKVAHIGDR